MILPVYVHLLVLCCTFHRGGDADDSVALAKETTQRQASMCSTLITFLKRSLKTKEDGGGGGGGGGGGDLASNGSPGMAVHPHAEVGGAVQMSQATAMKGELRVLCVCVCVCCVSCRCQHRSVVPSVAHT